MLVRCGLYICCFTCTDPCLVSKHSGIRLGIETIMGSFFCTLSEVETTSMPSKDFAGGLQVASEVSQSRSAFQSHKLMTVLLHNKFIDIMKHCNMHVWLRQCFLCVYILTPKMA